MKTNDIKKGTRVKLRNGWEATIEDNKRGNIRLATVEGFVTEMGSIYSHNIAAVLVDGKWVHDIELTKSQINLKEMGW